MKRYLTQNMKVVPAVIPQAGAVNPLTPVEVDGRGYDKALFIFATGAAAAGAKFNAKIQKAPSSGGDLVDVTDAALTEVLAASGASKALTIEVTIDPANPFMKITGEVTVDTFANSAVCLLHGGSGIYPKSAPATQAVMA